MKYTIDDQGLDWFKAELERRLGWQLAPAREVHFEHNGDRYGWVEGDDGNWHYTLFIENGRIRDWDGLPADERPARDRQGPRAASSS